MMLQKEVSQEDVLILENLKSLVDFQAMIPLDKGLKNTLESM